MKQTAVMIVENKVEAEAIALFDGELTFSEFMYNINKHFNRALAMEKEQIENAFNQGYTQCSIEDLEPKSRERFVDAKDYYNKTFKSE